MFQKQKGGTVLHGASFQGNKEALTNAIKINSNRINIQDDSGNTPIHYAIKNGYNEVTEILIKSGADTHIRNKKGLTALDISMEYPNIDVMSILTKYNPNFHLSCNAKPIHLYVKNLQELKKLVENNANIEQKTCYNQTAIHWASLNDAPESIEFLLSQGANLHAKDHKGHEPIHMASEIGQNEALKVLISNGAHINAHDINGSSPLHLASNNGHLSVVRTLLKAKADTYTWDMQGHTPLHLASNRGHATIAREIISHSTSQPSQKEALVRFPSMNGTTALHLAAKRGSLELVHMLISHGAELNGTDHHGSSALHKAVQHPKVVNTLISLGGSTKIRNRDQETPLDVAMKQNVEETYTLMIQK